jgi:hypothetical protein
VQVFDAVDGDNKLVGRRTSIPKPEAERVGVSWREASDGLPDGGERAHVAEGAIGRPLRCLAGATGACPSGGERLIEAAVVHKVGLREAECAQARQQEKAPEEHGACACARCK